MKKRIVYGFGEIVYDIISKDNKVLISQPGGSILNALINMSLRKCTTSIITQLGNCTLSKNVDALLKKHLVKTDLSFQTDRKIKLALSFLDKANNATYQFYEDKEPAKLNYSFPELTDNDILLFGSSAALDPANKEYIEKLLNKADAFSTLVYYDPNIRKSVAEKNPNYKDLAIRYISRADIVRGSVDDFEVLFETRDPEKIFKKTEKLGLPVLIVTDGEKPVNLYVNKNKISASFKGVKTLSTVGAGDAFNAVVISSLISTGNKKYSLKNITEKQWSKILKDATTVATEVCKSYSNFIKN